MDHRQSPNGEQSKQSLAGSNRRPPMPSKKKPIKSGPRLCKVCHQPLNIKIGYGGSIFDYPDNFTCFVCRGFYSPISETYLPHAKASKTTDF
jgi:hypothetical protein